MTETDPRLIRLVTRHFSDLQGYVRAPMGLVLAIPAIVYLTTHSDALGRTVMLCVFAATFLPMRAAHHYYRARFGRVEQGDKTYRLTLVLMIGTIALAPQLGVQWYWAIVAAQAGWLAVDGWPYRRHMLFEAAAAVFAALTAPFGGSTIHALMPGFALYGIACVMTGFADHALMVRAMRARSAAQPTD